MAEMHIEQGSWLATKMHFAGSGWPRGGEEAPDCVDLAVIDGVFPAVIAARGYHLAALLIEHEAAEYMVARRHLFLRERYEAFFDRFEYQLWFVHFIHVLYVGRLP